MNNTEKYIRRVLVCGGRDFDNYSKMHEVLEPLLQKHLASEKSHYDFYIISGEARGQID